MSSDSTEDYRRFRPNVKCVKEDRTGGRKGKEDRNSKRKKMQENGGDTGSTMNT